MYDTLILGPGGVKGFLHLGALSFYEKQLQNIKEFVGISIGSLISLLLVSGYEINQILIHAIQMEDVFNLKDILKVHKHFGLLSHDKIRKTLSDLVKNKFGFIPTLKELFSITKLKFSSITLNITTDTVVNLNHETHPDLCCVDAALMSMNIPLIFHKINYKGHLYVDGALGNPLPLDLYQDKNVLAFYIENVYSDLDDSYQSYILKILTCSITQLTLKNLNLKGKVIRLHTETKNTLGNGLNVKDKLDMFYKGYEIASHS